MKNTGTLLGLIQRLDEFEDGDRSHPLVGYAQNGADAGRNSRAFSGDPSEQPFAIAHASPSPDACSPAIAVLYALRRADKKPSPLQEVGQQPLFQFA